VTVRGNAQKIGKRENEAKPTAQKAKAENLSRVRKTENRSNPGTRRSQDKSTEKGRKKLLRESRQKALDIACGDTWGELTLSAKKKRKVLAGRKPRERSSYGPKVRKSGKV